VSSGANLRSMMSNCHIIVMWLLFAKNTLQRIYH